MFEKDYTMTNIIWGGLMIICMIINLTRIPYTIREEKYNSTAFSIGLAILCGMAAVWDFMS